MQVFVGDSQLMRSAGGIMGKIVDTCEGDGGLLHLQAPQLEQAAFAVASFFE